MATASFVKRVGTIIMRSAKIKGSSNWYSPHMAAASRAIAERAPLVDLILEIRDARIPLSSEYEQLRCLPSSTRRIIVLNKIDLANRMQVKDWIKYFDQQNCISYGVNPHNNDRIKEFLNFLGAQVAELKKTDHSGYTATVMLVGIPNVGKSALANSLHRIGRISAEEKGKLKHTIVSPFPGETKNISSLKIGSHPNIYVLDTPGVLSPHIPDAELFSKLALTGAISDCMIEEKELARYFLAMLNLSEEYKKWAKFSTISSDRSSTADKANSLDSSDSNHKQKRPSLSDHTQDVIVQGVRRSLYEAISSFDGNLADEEDLGRLIESQFISLHEAFHLPFESSDDNCSKMAAKLLNLYRTGRLGHYILDFIPRIP